MKLTTVKTLFPAPKDGEPGVDATSYYLVASPSAVIDVVNGASSTPDITIRGYCITGNDGTPVEVNNYVRIYARGWSDTPSTRSLPIVIKPSGLSVVIAAGLTSYHCEMLPPGSSSSTKTVATYDVVLNFHGQDGQDGEAGANGTSFIVKGSAVGIFDTISDIGDDTGICLVHDGRTAYNSIPPQETEMTVATGDAYIIGTNIWVAGTGDWINLGSFQGPKGAKGDKGDKGDSVTGETGAQGMQGPFAYNAGTWSGSITYTRTAESFPIVEYLGVYYIPITVGSSLNMIPSADSSYWKVLTKEDIVYAKIIMADFGKIASAVFADEFMFSQFGRLNGVEVDSASDIKESAYTNFNPSNPRGSTEFVPNLYFNFLTGDGYCRRMLFSGLQKRDPTYVTPTNINSFKSDDIFAFNQKRLDIEKTGNTVIFSGTYDTNNKGNISFCLPCFIRDMTVANLPNLLDVRNLIGVKLIIYNNNDTVSDNIYVYGEFLNHKQTDSLYSTLIIIQKGEVAEFTCELYGDNENEFIENVIWRFKKMQFLSK